ncbi:MAG: cadherin-like beta sandwich domain-containing protein [Prevotellaceae bacterium]|jgi:hypothetical protein|nr:cadherin-like beta sandwich domain-containing protein [Prevotellaceae bacterium]
MKRKLILWALMSMFTVVAVSSCNKDDDEKVVLSSDATLKSLTVSDGTLTPAFNAATIEYSVEVANSLTSITITGTANDDNAMVLGNAMNIPLATDMVVVSIVVTAEDGTTTKTYTVTVTREELSSPFDGNLSGTITGATAGQIDSIGIFYNSVIGEIKYPVTANGSFNISLLTPTEADLEPVTFPSTFSINPADAKTFFVQGNNYKVFKNGTIVGTVYKVIDNNENINITYLYANKDVTIVGTDSNTEHSYTYNLSYKTGWNIVRQDNSIVNDIPTVALTTGNLPNNIQWVLY